MNIECFFSISEILLIILCIQSVFNSPLHKILNLVAAFENYVSNAPRCLIFQNSVTYQIFYTCCKNVSQFLLISILLITQLFNYKYKEKLIILQSIGIIEIKRNKGGSLHLQIFQWAFNPYNSATAVNYPQQVSATTLVSLLFLLPVKLLNFPYTCLFTFLKR